VPRANDNARGLHNQPLYGYDIIITRGVYYWSSASCPCGSLSLCARAAPQRPSLTVAHARAYAPAAVRQGPLQPPRNYEDQYAARLLLVARPSSGAHLRFSLLRRAAFSPPPPAPSQPRVDILYAPFIPVLPPQPTSLSLCRAFYARRFVRR
jgi:hypothetical protein